MEFGDFIKEKAAMGSDARLEPALKKLDSRSYRNGCIQHGSFGVMK